jgi:hypothetical protein
MMLAFGLGLLAVVEPCSGGANEIFSPTCARKTAPRGSERPSSSL